MDGVRPHLHAGDRDVENPCHEVGDGPSARAADAVSNTMAEAFESEHPGAALRVAQQQPDGAVVLLAGDRGRADRQGEGGQSDRAVETVEDADGEVATSIPPGCS